LIDETHLDLSGFGSFIVKIKNQTNGMEMKYTLVAESGNLKTGKISVTSPIGKGLLGNLLETLQKSVPNGILKFEILEISRE
jgi:transcription elongation factor GreA